MIYRKEIKRAIDWLFTTQNKENFGWSWVRDISPNEQNTAEVVYAVSLFSDLLSENQKVLINQAVKRWLLLPKKHAVLTIDWAWVGLALSLFAEKYPVFQPEFGREFLEKDISTCVESVLSLQNPDGGWGDYKHDMSTAFRTSIAMIFLEKQQTVKDETLEKALENATKWLFGLQNEDGGFGNVPVENMTKKVLGLYAGVEQEIVESQYLSSMSATGYALWALSTRNKFLYSREIEKGYRYLTALPTDKEGYEIFFEVGIRRGTLFTFRHFGAAWMGIGLLSSGKSRFTSPEILKLVKYFLFLQDRVNGGFRCNDVSEVYTWSDCNALIFLRMAIDSLEEMSGLEYTDIIADYVMKLEEKK